MRRTVQSYPVVVTPLEDRVLMSVVLPTRFAQADIVAGPDGNMWFVRGGSGQVGRVENDGTVTQFEVFPQPQPEQAVSTGGQITAAGDALYFTFRQSNLSSIGRISTAGIFAPLVQLGGFTDDLITGPDGNLWVTQPNGDLGRISLAGEASLIDLPGLSDLNTIATGPDGRVWFTGTGNGFNWRPVVGSIQSDGTDARFYQSDVLGYVQELAAGPDGNLYGAAWGQIFRITTEGAITVIELTDNSDPAHLASGSDGQLWFIDQRSILNPLVRLNDDDSFSRFASGTPITILDALTSGPGGRLWYMDSSEDGVGFVDLDDQLLGTSVRLNVDHRKTFSQAVASFTDPLGRSADAFTANIDWGDETTSVGTITPNAVGGFDVSGEHAYPFGWHEIVVRVSDGERSASITSAAYSIPSPIAGKGRNIDPTAGRSFRGTVAVYTGLDVASLDRYAANINWGDGSSSSGTLLQAADGSVRVVGTHTYIKPGFFNLHVTVDEVLGDNPFLPNGGVFPPGGFGPVALLGDGIFAPGPSYSPFNDARSRATVAPGSVDGDLLSPRITSGLKFDGAIARFVTADPGDDISFYRAEVDWGGGETASGTIVADGTGAFKVHAQRVFLQSGSNPVTVRIYDERLEGLGTVGIATGRLWVDTHLSVTSNQNLPSATAGVPYRVKLGSIRSVGASTLWNSEFAVTIYWGDGTTSPGEVVPTGAETFDVFGEHTYEITGRSRSAAISFRVEETRTPLDPSLPTPSRTYTAGSNYVYINVKPGEFPGFTLDPTNGHGLITGQNLRVRVGVITIGQALQASDFSGSVTWNDGIASSLIFEPNGDGTFTVYADRSFPAGGSYVATLTVTAAGITRTAESRFSVTAPAEPPFAEVLAGSIHAIKGVEFSGLVGRFRPRDPNSVPADFTVMIHWGEGGASPGEIRIGEEGWFEVYGTHTYYQKTENTRSYSITVSNGQRSLWASGMYTVVLDPTRINAEGENLHFRQREEFTTKVASFTSPDASAGIEDFEAWIEWGDGTRTPGEITVGYQGRFDVSGTKTYHKSGFVQIRVTVTGPGGSDVAISNMNLDRDPVAVTPLIPQATGFEISGRLATFIDEDGPTTDPLRFRVYHAGMIDWGDGTISLGTIIQRSDGTFDLEGSHRYERPGNYTVRLVVRRNTRDLPRLERPWWLFNGRVALDAGVAPMAQQDQSLEYKQTLWKVRVNRTGARVVVTPTLRRAHLQDLIRRALALRRAR